MLNCFATGKSTGISIDCAHEGSVGTFMLLDIISTLSQHYISLQLHTRCMCVCFLCTNNNTLPCLDEQLFNCNLELLDLCLELATLVGSDRASNHLCCGVAVEVVIEVVVVP